MAKLVFLNSRAFTKRTGGPQRSPRPRRGGGRVLSVGTLVVGVVACHLGAHGGGCSVPGGQWRSFIKATKHHHRASTRSGITKMDMPTPVVLDISL
jgi:hypothetical protein